jgi:hypothetical protein
MSFRRPYDLSRIGAGKAPIAGIERMVGLSSPAWATEPVLRRVSVASRLEPIVLPPSLGDGLAGIPQRLGDGFVPAPPGRIAGLMTGTAGDGIGLERRTSVHPLIHA